jgi:hypothetical protein
MAYHLQTKGKMRKNQLICRWLFWLACFTLLVSQKSFPQTYSETKKISKSFKVNHLFTVDVNNKYGTVNFVNWTKDSVRIEIVLSVNTTQTSRLKEILGNTDFSIQAAGTTIIAKTIFGAKGGGFLSDIKSISENISSSSDVRIDYFISHPSYMNIKVANKYGNIKTSSIKGAFTAALSNGNLIAENLSGISNIDVKFGDISISRINTGKIIASYGEINIENAEHLTLETRSEKMVKIEQANDLKILSKRDKLNIIKVNSLYGETYFSDLQTGTLSGEMSLTMKYGTLAMENISKGFSFINLNSKNTGIKIGFKKETAFQFELDLLNIIPKISEEANLAQKAPATPGSEAYLLRGKFGKAEKYPRINIKAESAPLSILSK